MTEKVPSAAEMLTRDDLRAAVAAGVLSEAQAASVQALAASRLAGRPRGDDEPFELFRGFAEILVSLGLIILMAGLMALAAASGNVLFLCAVGLALSVGLASYFTLRRRMVLPSIILVCGYACAVVGLVLTLEIRQATGFEVLSSLRFSLPVALFGALLVWYWRFRLPFTMFLLAQAGLWLTLAIMAPGELARILSADGVLEGLSLTSGSRIGLATLVAGLFAAGAGLWFDLRDRYRLGRASASAFWLHVVAAPLIVNTLAQTALAREGLGQYLAMAAVLLVITVFALIVDRRSFLTAGLGYLIWLIWAIAHRDGDGLDLPAILILIGGAVTALGAWWVPLRAALMGALPDFPGKDRLPPYSKGVL